MGEGKGSKQGFNAQIFTKAVKLAAGTHDLVPVKIYDALVISGSQNSDTMTCFINSVDSSILGLEVRYNLCISDGEVCVPEDDSVVTIASTSFTDPYIVKFTDLKTYDLVIGDASIHEEGGKILISQGSNPVEGVLGIQALFSNTKFGLKNDEQDFTQILKSFMNNVATFMQHVSDAILDTPAGDGAIDPSTQAIIANDIVNVNENITNLLEVLQ